MWKAIDGYIADHPTFVFFMEGILALTCWAFAVYTKVVNEVSNERLISFPWEQYEQVVVNVPKSISIEHFLNVSEIANKNGFVMVGNSDKTGDNINVVFERRAEVNK